MNSNKQTNNMYLQIRHFLNQVSTYLFDTECALGDLGNLLSFWSELAEVTQRGAVPVALLQRKTPADQVQRKAQEKEE
ncbi:jg18408 [Pararge aegeria aegeria]|uniref:Jg18408 protein n=1 Tax=Pararge aegeria aegeria TaxID=348720 RepID=A0A8S4RAI0_9NEOP|nr:jg18408 [Pararge aegeria aegeria]